MNSEIKVYSYPNGEIQRVQAVRLDDWSQLHFMYLEQGCLEQQLRALNCFSDVYQNYLIPACPWIFPQMVLVALPEDDAMDALLAECAGKELYVQDADGTQLEKQESDVLKQCGNGENAFFYKSEKYGIVSDKLTIASILLEKGVKLKGGKPVFSDAKVEAFYKELEARGCVHIACGKLPSTKIIPVSRCTGYLSENETDAQMKVNAHFFIMDPFDCATVYDHVGMPFGLCVKDGVIENPPLFGRESLLVEQDGVSYISNKDVSDLLVEINGKTYMPGKNAVIYTRPKRAKSPEEKGNALVIIGRRVVAVKQGGNAEIPAAGFVMQVSKGSKVAPGDEVIYHGLKDVQFGIQVGNSIIRKEVKTEKFISRFYNIYHLERIPYPPCLFPMDFKNARAARMAIGADKDRKPVIFWAEGKGKLRYTPGEDSRGATLPDMADIAADLGLRNAVNLDGGGSAQILLSNERVLRIADRNKADNSDAERSVPLGLIVK